MHNFAIFVQGTSSEGQSVHKFVVFVQQNAAEASSVHKKPVFVHGIVIFRAARDALAQDGNSFVVSVPDFSD